MCKTSRVAFTTEAADGRRSQITFLRVLHQAVSRGKSRDPKAFMDRLGTEADKASMEETG